MLGRSIGIDLVLLPSAFVLLVIGAFIVVNSVMGYIQVTQYLNEGKGRWVTDEQGNSVLLVNAGIGWKKFSDVQREYAANFTNSGLLVAGGAALLVLYYSKRKHMNAKQIL